MLLYLQVSNSVQRRHWVAINRKMKTYLFIQSLSKVSDGVKAALLASTTLNILLAIIIILITSFDFRKSAKQL